ncbi:ANTAR domain-containing protein [Actinomycetota bacterium Odt1-20B]
MDRSTELRLAEVVVESADTLRDDFRAEHYLRGMADHCVELFGAHTAGVMFTHRTGESRTIALAPSSHQQEVAIALLRSQRSDGPCVESYSTGTTVAPVRLTERVTAIRWPEFTAQALEHGVTMTYAVPMRRGESVFGVLNVFLARQATPNGEVRCAEILASAAALGLHNHEAYAGYRTLSRQLETALTSRIRVEQAKGILAERWRTGMEPAFAALRGYARRERLAIDRVAGELIEGKLNDAALRPGRSGPDETEPL